MVIIDAYMSRVTDCEGLEDLVQEAKHNHRVQKILVPYVAKDKETFREMLQLARQDLFAKKLVLHCHAILHDLTAGKIHDREAVKELVCQVNQITESLAVPRPEVDMEPWEFVGYGNAFTQYLLQEKMDNMASEQLRKRDELLKAFEDIEKRWEAKEPKNELVELSVEEWIREIEESRDEWEEREKREFGE